MERANHDDDELKGNIIFLITFLRSLKFFSTKLELLFLYAPFLEGIVINKFVQLRNMSL